MHSSRFHTQPKLHFITDFFDKFKNGAEYEPSSKHDTETIVDLLDIKRGDHAVDVGSGDGRIVIAMAQKGAQSVGFENDPKLVKLSRKNIEKNGVQPHARIRETSFWEEDFSSFNKIAIFQWHTVMPRLEKKLEQELQKGTKVVSHHWEFPHWTPVKQVRDIFLYIID